jgi:hypothetical protein
MNTARHGVPRQQSPPVHGRSTKRREQLSAAKIGREPLQNPPVQAYQAMGMKALAYRFHRVRMFDLTAWPTWLIGITRLDNEQLSI